MVKVHAAPRPHIPDSWARSPETELHEDTKRRYHDFEEHRAMTRGAPTEEERVYFAIPRVGPAAPLDVLATEAGLTWGRTLDSARKACRRYVKRLAARELVEVHHVRGRFDECTHTSLPGRAGRMECQRLRKEAGVTTGCVAHHGHTVRRLLPLKPHERARRLDLPDELITRRVRERDELTRVQREEDGTPANDAEARRWSGRPVTRGPRGTNHTSSRRGQSVPPIPFGESLGTETSQYQAGSEGQSVAPAAPGLASREAPPRPAAASARPESHEGKGARAVPSPRPVTNISEARETRAKVDWFRQQWAARGLPPLTMRELREVLWVRCRQLSREDLGVLVGCAERRARRGARRPAGVLCVTGGELSAMLHDERKRREIAGELAPAAPVREMYTPPAPPASEAPRTMEDFVRERDRWLAALEASRDEDEP